MHMLPTKFSQEMKPRLTVAQRSHYCGDTSLPLVTMTSSKQPTHHLTDGSVYTEAVICSSIQLRLDNTASRCHNIEAAESTQMLDLCVCV